MAASFGQQEVPAALQRLSLLHKPQIPPQPSSPQTFPSHFGVQQDAVSVWLESSKVFATQTCWRLASHKPQTSPQPLLPQVLLVQLGTQGQVPQSFGQLEQVSMVLPFTEAWQ
jgi:hypothetical protein